MAEKLHKYGVIFWTGEDADDEIETFFMATDYFAAERYAAQFNKPGYTRYDPIFMDGSENFNTPIEEFCR